MAAKYKVISLNCRGLNNPIKAKRISALATKLRPSILMLQETHIKRTDRPVLKSNWWSLQLQAPGSSKARGVAILFAKSIMFRVVSTLGDPQGRFLFVKGYLADTMVTLANLYVPNSGQLEFIQDVLGNLDDFKEGDLLMGGDFNLILDGMKDKSRFNPKKKTNGKPNILPPFSSKFASVLETYNLVDIWRLQHESE